MKDYFFIFIAVTACALEYVLIKSAKQMPLFFTGMIVFSTAAILLTASAVKAGYFKNGLYNGRKYFFTIIIVGFIGTLCNILWILGTRNTSVVNASALSRSDVLFTLFLSFLVFRENIPYRVFLFIPIMLAGMVMLTEISFQKLQPICLGDLAILGSAFFLSLNAFIIKKTVKFLPGTLLAVGNCIINAAFFSVMTYTYEHNSLSSITPDLIFIIVLCGVCSWLFFISYYKALKIFPVWQVRLLCLATPCVSTIFAFFFLKKPISFIEITGILLIIIGAACIIYISRTHPGPQLGIHTFARGRGVKPAES